MTLTFIGMLLLAIGLPIVLYGRTEAVLALLLACGLLGGSAAINLPALGGSSIMPTHFALLLAGMRIFLPGSGRGEAVRAGVAANLPLILFALYGLLMALVGPRLFRGDMAVPMMRETLNSYIYATRPLAPAPQNITTAVYLVGGALCAIVAYVACSGRRGGLPLVRAAVVVAWANVALGLVVMLTRHTPAEAVFELFRNGSYAMLTHEYGGFVRITGLFPEASSYAAYAFVWFCFLFECWYRDVLPRRTGPATLAVFGVLMASTSATAYVGIALFGLILAARMIVPGAARSDKLVPIGLALTAGMVVAILMVLLQPAAGAQFVEMVNHMTLDKSTSTSGLQRAFWARKGLEAFAVSGGIGIGPGSFRSSSLITAVLGSLGVVGMVLFVAHVLRVLKPERASTYGPVADTDRAIGVAAGWGALMVLVPAGLTSPSCDPGADFAILSGAALALRALPARRRIAAPDFTFPKMQPRMRTHA